jgi:F-type H+/Na+-transporting ATPase subunit beta
VPQPEPSGHVHAVRGAVVDVRYDAGTLPALNDALLVDWDRPGPLLLEVQSHLDLTTIRAVALQATAGLSRGVAVRSTGAPIMVPVGAAVLGRLLDVTGEVRDLEGALPARPRAGRSMRPRRRWPRKAPPPRSSRRASRSSTC